MTQARDEAFQRVKTNGDRVADMWNKGILKTKKFLFVCGCPRSGTSALTQLLSASDEVVLGMERYGHLVDPDNFSLTKEHFTEERFFDIQPGDTFYESLDMQPHFASFYQRLRNKFPNSKYVGDKRPTLYQSYGPLFGQFPDAKVVFIFRNPLEVASSYKQRVKDGAWRTQRDFDRATIEWNQSISMTLEAMRENPGKFLCVEYSDVFDSSKDLTPIFDSLNLFVDENVARKISSLRSRNKTIKSKRSQLLNEDEIAFVKRECDLKLLERINRENILHR